MGHGHDYMDSPGDPLYSFGHGLSYTSFEYSNLLIRSAADGKSCEVSYRITNIGNRSGAEVVQLYLRDVVASVSQPPMLLKGFTLIELSPGESRTTTFNLGAEELSIYNAGLERVIEPGLFKVMIGASSADIRLTGDFTL